MALCPTMTEAESPEFAQADLGLVGRLIELGILEWSEQ